jgi:hypothetical protein
LPPGGGDFGQQGVESGVRIEQRALCVAAQQRLVGVLTVNVDQRFGHLAQLRTVTGEPFR